ncbi:GHKL domain-containing protein [Candidatus Allofournierella excrementavium]|uniref:sensor histidine kinase n=1 Tax=Candidatus Allofournierella excrementavium TaxID=2838591 RepID=UPI003AF9F402
MNPGDLADIPRLYTALAEWLACLVYILSLLPEKRGSLRFWGLAAGMLAVQSIFLVATDDVPLPLWIPCMLAAIGLMFLFLFLACGRGALNAGYYTVRAFILAEFGASLEWQLYYHYANLAGQDSFLARLAFLAVVYAVVFGLMFLLEARSHAAEHPITITPRELANAAIIGASAFLISNLSYTQADTPFSSQYVGDIFNIRTLVDLGGIAILYAYHLQRAELQVRHELETMDSILRSQYAQYQQSRESIDLINRKYHDLKHQIAALRAEPDAERRSAWLDEMESDINTYEAQNKTGNQVLDVLLTGKSLYCQKHDIHLTTVADGTVLAGVSPMDLCTLVGNALDNAIESVKKIEDKEKRLIHVAVSRQKNFALLRFENCFEGELTFENGLPRTTKGNTDYHGYGLKSIRRTAQKYGGTVTVNTRKNWFELKILLPLAEGTQEK